jgi:YD repeat-containing protein
MLKLSLYILLLPVLLTAVLPARAERIVLQSSFYYTFDGPYDRYATFKEVFDLHKARFAADINTRWGLSRKRVIGISSTGITKNGIPHYRIDTVSLNPDTGEYGTGISYQLVSMIPQCPLGFRIETDPITTHEVRVYNCYAASNLPEPCETCGEGVGNPILPSAYVKQQNEVDYRSAGPGGLEFVRTYRSDRNGWVHNYAIGGGQLKTPPQALPPEATDPPAERKIGVPSLCHWGIFPTTGKSYCFLPRPNYNFQEEFMIRRGNARLVKFGGPTSFAPAPHINDRWTPLYQNGVKTGHQVYNAGNDSFETYGLNGLIQTITARNGQVTHFAYERFQGPDTYETPELVLSSVTDHFGRKLTFAYNEEGRMKSMTTPANEVYTYEYDETSGGGSKLGNLTSVTYPDDKKRIYWYNEPAHTAGANLPYALTGITDENGARFATFKYYSGGTALSTEHAGGVNKYSINGSALNRKVTDPFGTIRSYNYVEKPSGFRLASKSQPAGAGAIAATERREYDVNENLSAAVGYNGVTTKYTYDLARNLELTRTEAFGLPEQRVTTTEWHPTYRIPVQVAEPKRRTIYAYYPNGELKTRTVQATTDASGANAFTAALTGAARTWSYTYNAQWQVETITGPVAGDITTYAYDASTGDLRTITNAVGHVTRFDEYDGNGRAGLVTQPDGVKIRSRYSPRGWLESSTVSDGGIDLTTSYGYDNVGQLKTLTAPDGSVISYTYDDAHRLTDVADAKGNKIHYVLDNMGNRTSEQVTDPVGTLRRQLTRQYDALSRVKLQTGGAQ